MPFYSAWISRSKRSSSLSKFWSVMRCAESSSRSSGVGTEVGSAEESDGAVARLGAAAPGAGAPGALGAGVGGAVSLDAREQPPKSNASETQSARLWQAFGLNARLRCSSLGAAPPARRWALA